MLVSVGSYPGNNDKNIYYDEENTCREETSCGGTGSRACWCARMAHGKPWSRGLWNSWRRNNEHLGNSDLECSAGRRIYRLCVTHTGGCTGAGAFAAASKSPAPAPPPSYRTA